MSSTDDWTRHLVTRFYDDMWNAFDTSVLDAITSPRVRFQGSLGDTTTGRTDLEAYVRKVQTAFPDFHNEVRDLVVEGSRAFARLRYTGTHLGPLGHLEPTGSRVEYSGAALFTVAGGVIAEVWVLGDRVRLYQQIGLSSLS